jgi:hypothetical protein
MKKIKLVLITISLFLMSITVNVKAAEINVAAGESLSAKIASSAAGDTINLESGATFSETSTLVIDKSLTINGNGATINSKIKITGSGITVAIKNANVVNPGNLDDGKALVYVTATDSDITISDSTLDNNSYVGTAGTDNKKILRIEAKGSNINVTNTTFKNFAETGLWASALKTITVTGSTFDGKETTNAGSGAGTSYQFRSGAGIDLNLGDAISGVDVTSIKINNNTFKNVAKAVTTGSTAGGLKIKIKNADNAKISGLVEIQNNSFVDNTQDIVLGTPTSTATSEDPTTTSNFNVQLYKNTTTTAGTTKSSVTVVNNGATTSTTEEIASNILATRNYTQKSNTEKNIDQVYVTIDNGGKGETSLVNVGTKIGDVPNLSNYKTKEGYTFKYFSVNGTQVSEDSEITEPITLVPVFEKIVNPSTSDNIDMAVILFIVSLLGIASIIIVPKKIAE